MAERQRPQVPGMPKAPGLQPAATPLDAYNPRLIAPTIVQGRPDPHNSWMDLARGLSQLEPTLLQYQRQFQAEENKNKEAEGDALFQQTKEEHRLRVSFKDAVKKGLIPAGANPFLVKGWQRAELRDIATDYQMALQKAYMEDDRVRNSDDPAVFQEFTQKMRRQFRKDHLTDQYGQEKFTPLDLHEVFFPAEDHMEGSLRGQHINHRIQEHERLAEDRASNRINRMLEHFSSEEFSLLRPETKVENLAFRINQEFYHETEGMVPNGLDGKKANEIMVDNIVAHAVKERDPELLAVLDHIKTPGGSLGGTKQAREKRVQAEERIAALNMRDEQYRWAREAHKWALSPEEEAKRREADYQRKLEMQARSDEQYEREKNNWLKLDVQDMVQHRTNAEVSRVLAAVRMKDMDNPMLHSAMSWMRDNAPDSYMRMEQYINTLTKERAAFHETPESRLFSTQIRYDMSQHPENFDASRIFKGVADGMVDEKQAFQMLDDWERLRQDMDHPFIQHREFRRLLDSAAQSTKKSAEDDFGAGAIRASEAVTALRSYASAWIKDHPQGKQTEFLKDIASYMKVIQLQHNEDFRAEEESKKDRAENPPAPKQPERGFFGKITDKLGITTPPEPVKAPEPTKPAMPELSARDITTLMAKETRDEIAGMVREAQAGKIKRQDLIDRLIPTFVDIHSKTGRDVIDAVRSVNKYVDTLLRAKPKDAPKATEGSQPVGQPSATEGAQPAQGAQPISPQAVEPPSAVPGKTPTQGAKPVQGAQPAQGAQPVAPPKPIHPEPLKPPQAEKPVPPVQNTLSPKEIGKKLSKEDRDKLVDVINGVKDGSLKDKEVKDRVIPILAKVYKAEGKSIEEAMQASLEFVSVIMQSKKKGEGPKLFGNTAEEKLAKRK